MGKHTPGPWIVSGPTVMAEAPLRMVATVGAPSSRGDEDAANARLIAAAPEMLTVLKRVERDFDIGASSDPLRAIRAAIARAEGRS